MDHEPVSSARNPKIKQLLLLQEKSRVRQELGLFVVEGRRELAHCLGEGYRARTVFWCPELLPELPDLPGDPPVVEVPAALYERIAYRGGTEGILAEVQARRHELEDIHLPASPLVVVLEGVEKPGNLGAVLRSADAAGADAVILCDPQTDLYNPNLIRASLGAVFTLQVATASSEAAIRFLKARGIRILTAQLQDSRPYYDTPMRDGTALVMGTEATGLTGAWREAADAHILIPMRGRLDSLNVSVSAAILLYEAVRQRTICK